MVSQFFTLLAAATILLNAQTPAKKTWTPPRTADGHPDLQGIWTNATLTRMERLPQFNGKLNLTDAEAAAFEKKDRQEGEEEPGKDGVVLGGVKFSGANAGYNALFIDRGSQLARVDGQKRSSLIIDPPDGKMPARVPRTGGARFGAAQAAGGYANVKNHPISERCLLGFGSTSGPPMMPVLYNNNYQIVETPNSILILVEMVHDARVIRMGGTHPPSGVRQWLGDSIGHWEGDTLVVDTTNFNDETGFYGASGKTLHTSERFQRIDRNTILYRVTIDDPGTWTKPWTMEYPFLADKGPVYEYACHEGNYAMDDILGGATRR
jgi:hypothetical protein